MVKFLGAEKDFLFSIVKIYSNIDQFFFFLLLTILSKIIIISNYVFILLTKMNNPKSQRALVFQGGGALGAYEAGAYQTIYEYILKREGHNYTTEKNLFDVVIGTIYWIY